jgi:PAS domain S-box-containing protein
MGHKSYYGGHDGRSVMMEARRLRRVEFRPDDHERLMNEQKAKFLRGNRYQTKARLKRNDGKYRWFLFRTNPLRDEQGRITRWYVAATHIEDREQA